MTKTIPSAVVVTADSRGEGENDSPLDGLLGILTLLGYNTIYIMLILWTLHKHEDVTA